MGPRSPTRSSPRLPHYSVAIKRGILNVLEGNDVAPGQVREYTHGATVATNAIITRSGALTGRITTKGFRDVLEIRRMPARRARWPRRRRTCTASASSALEPERTSAPVPAIFFGPRGSLAPAKDGYEFSHRWCPTRASGLVSLG